VSKSDIYDAMRYFMNIDAAKTGDDDTCITTGSIDKDGLIVINEVGLVPNEVWKNLTKEKKMSKFKVGDKVKILSDAWLNLEIGGVTVTREGFESLVGKTGKIYTTYDDNRQYHVKTRNQSWTYLPDQLELVSKKTKFKVGDKVKILSTPPSVDEATHLVGEIGTVSASDEGGCSVVALNEWWRYDLDQLELVSKKQKKPRKTVTLKIGDVIKGNHQGSVTMTITGFDYDTKDILIAEGRPWAEDYYLGKISDNPLKYVNGKKVNWVFPDRLTEFDFKSYLIENGFYLLHGDSPSFVLTLCAVRLLFDDGKWVYQGSKIIEVQPTKHVADELLKIVEIHKGLENGNE